MVIQHNIMALNAHRNLSANYNKMSKCLERLSSGYRINRAGDDAAGLGISERMRAQITGLKQAVLNAQDGMSLVQTAEGAMAEVHSMLNRMVELATQSANGTIQGADRDKLESELNALKDEIDRISQATNFNGIQLLDGGSVQAGSVQGGSLPEIVIDLPPAGLEDLTEAINAPEGGGRQTKSARGGLVLQVGDTAHSYNQIGVPTADMSVDGLGLRDITFSTQESSSDALEVIRAAIEKVSAHRASLGALYNRLEYTVNSLNSAIENLTAAESRLRDADMAKEMMEFTKMNVLTQAAQAMLAQANMQPQQILQLLRQ